MDRDEELQRRNEMWAALLEGDGPTSVPPRRLRELGIYGGAQGIWVDKARTASVSPDGTGVTVGLLHTGSSYADDLFEDGVLYHYPSTGRGPSRDLAEVEATKWAAQLRLPVFVITYPAPGSGLRDVRRGWVEGWEDASRLFLVTFQDEPPEDLIEPVPETDPFELEEERRKRRRQVDAREGQQKFKLRVFQYYGPACAVCDVEVPEVLDAAHIRPKRLNGSDDPRNGLVLCAAHHRAYDAGLFAIDPGNLDLHFKPTGPSAEDLRISRISLVHLTRKPHPDALDWAWDSWSRP